MDEEHKQKIITLEGATSEVSKFCAGQKKILQPTSSVI